METENIHNPQCFANHLGPWLVYSPWFLEAVRNVKRGLWAIKPIKAELTEQEQKVKSYFYSIANGVAVIHMSGVLMKGESKFGGTVNSIAIRRALRMAARDEDVTAIMLVIDSPGGSVAGTEDLANDVADINQKKPIYAHASDLTASAAFWVASQTRRITANSTAMVGSIGTVAVVEDTSKKAEMEGVKVHVISTGKFKGAFTDGTPVLEEHLSYLQEIINKTNEHFLNAVAKGRQMKMSDLEKVADGRVFMADDAKAAGLIDQVQSLDHAISVVATRHGRRKAVLADLARMENQ